MLLSQLLRAHAGSRLVRTEFDDLTLTLGIATNRCHSAFRLFFIFIDSRNRHLSPSISKMAKWWVRRSRGAAVIVPCLGLRTGSIPRWVAAPAQRLSSSASSFWSSAKSTGLTRCPSQPASLDCTRSPSCPQPVNAMIVTSRPHGCCRIRRDAS